MKIRYYKRIDGWRWLGFLLAMIGEERESIDAEMVQRVTSGQIPDAENLKKLS